MKIKKVDMNIKINGGGVKNRIDCAVEKQIGKILKDYRKKNSISLSKMAEKLNISLQQIQKYETGENRISLSRFIQYCKILKQNPIIMFTEIDKIITQNAIKTNKYTAIQPIDTINTTNDFLKKNHKMLITLGKELERIYFGE